MSDANDERATFLRGFQAGWAAAKAEVKYFVDDEGWSPIAAAPPNEPIVVDVGGRLQPRVCRYCTLPVHGFHCVDNLGNVGTEGYQVITVAKRWRPVSEAWHTSHDKRYD